MPRKLTQFGMELRKYRIERTETLADMARAIDVSPSFLSGIETGRKHAPGELVERIIQHLQLDMIAAANLRRAAEETGPELRISLADKGNDAREVAAMFARCFSDENLAELRGALQQLEKRRGSASGTGT